VTPDHEPQGQDFRGSQAVSTERNVPDPADVAAAFASETRRSYAVGWRQWQAWCAARGASPLPAATVDVAAYAKALAEKGMKLGSIRVRLAAISQVHKLAGHPLNRNDPALSYAMKALANKLGDAREGRAEVMTADLAAMLEHLDRTTLRGKRDAAMLLLGFAGGLRRSEIVALNLPDLEWRKEGVIVRLRRSKTDQAGRGQQVGILRGSYPATCPYRALRAWLDAVTPTLAVVEGPLFRQIGKGGAAGRRVSDQVVYHLVKRLGAKAGLDASRLGAHSLRVGHVTQALANGADVVKAKDQLRHKRLDTTLGYNRRRSLLADNTSGKLGL
jgi:site-specific recombinase XerD